MRGSFSAAAPTDMSDFSIVTKKFANSELATIMYIMDF